LRLVCGRRIFGRFAHALESNPTESSIAVGINPTSYQWSQLAPNLGLFNPKRKIWLFDQDRFDINIRYAVLERVWENIEPCIHPSLRTRARHYFESLAQQIHVWGRNAYLTFGINASGDFLTSIIGSIVSMMAARGFFDFVGEEFKGTFYSDDSLITVKDTCKATPEQYRDYCRRVWGLFVTSADKTDDLTPVPPEKAVFLARRFVRDDDRVVWAPLDQPTIRSMLQYVRSDDFPTQQEQIASRIDSAFLEACQHDKSFYNDAGYYPRV
jgi:hypothetical protein